MRGIQILKSRLLIIHIIILLLFSMIASNSFGNQIGHLSSEKENDTTYKRYRQLKILGIVFASVGIGIMGFGGMYYNDYKKYGEDTDYPAREVGTGMLLAGSTFATTGSILFFKYRKKLNNYETQEMDISVSGGISKESYCLSVRLSF